MAAGRGKGGEAYSYYVCSKRQKEGTLDCKGVRMRMDALDEIVVKGDSKRKIPHQRLYIGMDTIGHCASLTYDFEAGTVTLMCPNQP